jgi:transcriptional antiterminator RfaH
LSRATASGEHWFALYAKPHREYAVRDYLTGHKVEAYLPEVRTRSQRRDRRGKRPFFPHYLFARLDIDDGIMAKIPWTPGLRQIVSFGGEPAPVPDEVVAHIRCALATLLDTETEELFAKGDVATCRAAHSRESMRCSTDSSVDGRVRVFLKCMDRLMAAELDIDDLMPPQ